MSQVLEMLLILVLSPFSVCLVAISAPAFSSDLSGFVFFF